MTRVVVSLAVLMLLGASPAFAQCWPVTVSGSAAFKKQLSPAERRAAGSEARRRGCSQKPVPNDTPGAIDGETAASLMPMIKAELAKTKRGYWSSRTQALNVRSVLNDGGGIR